MLVGLQLGLQDLFADVMEAHFNSGLLMGSPGHHLPGAMRAHVEMRVPLVR